MFREKPHQFHTPPGRVPSPSVPRWVGNQRSWQNDGGHPKQNPVNIHANPFGSPRSRQNKFDPSKLVKPPAWYYCGK